MPDLPEIMIHAGAHKTGSSSIQAALLEVRDHLTMPDGSPMLYPQAALHRKNHLLLAHQYTGKNPPVEVSYIDQLKAEVEQRAPGGMILSAEAFENVPPQALADDFNAAFGSKWRTGMQIYLRASAPLALSRFDQITMNIWNTPDLHTFLAAYSQHYSRPLFLQRWEQALPGAIYVKPFSRKHLLNGDVVDDFFDFLVGRDHPASTAAREVPSRNAGRPASLVCMMSEAKQKLADQIGPLDGIHRKNQRRVAKRLRRLVQQDCPDTGLKLRWRRADLEAFLLKIGDEVRAIDDKYFGAPIHTEDNQALLDKTPDGADYLSTEEATGLSRAEIDERIDSCVAKTAEFVAAGEHVAVETAIERRQARKKKRQAARQAAKNAAPTPSPTS